MSEEDYELNSVKLNHSPQFCCKICEKENSVMTSLKKNTNKFQILNVRYVLFKKQNNQN